MKSKPLVPAIRRAHGIISKVQSVSLTGYDPKRVVKMFERGGQMGWSVPEIAAKLGVTESRLRRWIKRYPATSRGYQKGIDLRAMEIESALVKNAVGYKVVERNVKRRKGPEGDSMETSVTYRHVGGSVAAQKLFLERRKKSRWGTEGQEKGKMQLQLVIDASDENL